MEKPDFQTLSGSPGKAELSGSTDQADGRAQGSNVDRSFDQKVESRGQCV